MFLNYTSHTGGGGGGGNDVTSGLLHPYYKPGIVHSIREHNSFTSPYKSMR